MYLFSSLLFSSTQTQPKMQRSCPLFPFCRVKRMSLSVPCSRSRASKDREHPSFPLFQARRVQYARTQINPRIYPRIDMCFFAYFTGLEITSSSPLKSLFASRRGNECTLAIAMLGSLPLSLPHKTIKGRKQINELGFSNTEKNSHACLHLQNVDRLREPTGHRLIS